ncbi:MAG TPA: hypothetical protein VFY17_10380 [Pilimelia sp.]|nr:hypothetical protein [Pilimelia sp.]
MVVGSLVLILAAVVLFGVGVAEGSSPLFAASIVVSLLAGFALVVGVRQSVAPQASAEGGLRIPRPSRAATPFSAGTRARLAAMTHPVHVTDGDTSFHLPGCGDLGRGGRQVPVSTAVSAGLAPCRWCRPVEALLRPVGGRP